MFNLKKYLYPETNNISNDLISLNFEGQLLPCIIISPKQLDELLCNTSRQNGCSLELNVSIDDNNVSVEFVLNSDTGKLTSHPISIIIDVIKNSDFFKLMCKTSMIAVAKKPIIGNKAIICQIPQKTLHDVIDQINGRYDYSPDNTSNNILDDISDGIPSTSKE